MPTAPSTTPATDNDAARLELVRLGQADRPWEFLARSVVWLRANPADHGVRFLAASNAAGLGLKTLAAECLAPLPEEAAADERVRSLAASIESLADDEIPLGVRSANARRGLEALHTRGLDLSAEFVKWQTPHANERWFRSIDGNTVRCTDASDPLGSCLWLADLRGGARAFCESTVECDDYQAPAPFVVEGINPPWILSMLADALAATRTGYQTAIHVVQADPGELFDGLACEDLHDLLTNPRIHTHLGEHAGQHLGDTLTARLEHELPGRMVSSPTAVAKVAPTVSQTLHALKSKQVAALASCAQRAKATYEPRDAAWWADRFTQINSGNGEPLRVLLITSRFTTFVQHAAADLAQAVRASGGEARVLIEPDDSTRMSKLAHLQAVEDFEPDLLVMINYTRAHLGPEMPAHLPVVCWIQDTMAHLFTPEAGAAQGPFDVLLGNHHSELFQHHGFDMARYLHSPVAVSDQKFHAGPCTDNQSDRFACEIAYVSHHSETPERMLARLKDEAGPSPAAGLLDSVAPLVHKQLDRLADEPIRLALRTQLTQLAEQHLGSAPPPRLISDLLDQVAIPLAERIVRHRALEWAAQIANRRGWRLKLFGNGWETHPSLADHAAGPLDHNDDLRASYQLARVHLHASVSPLTHQRLMECALSGGFPLAMLNHDARITPERLIASLGWRSAVEQLVPETEPDTASLAQYGDRCRLEDHAVGYRLTEHHALLARAAQLQRLGAADPADGDVLWCDARRVRMNLELRACGQLDWNAASLFGDLAAHTFTGRDGFETLLTRAIENAPWRRAQSAAMADRVRSGGTHSAMLARLLGWFPKAL
ncbi:MAG: hypothetical protein ACI89L_002093 [Phycisphaerales bacterium]|jgi:hypothetical protein